MVVDVEQPEPTAFEQLAEQLTIARMMHYGYPAPIVRSLLRQLDSGAHHTVHGCERTEHGWDCRDDADKPRHPNHDDAADAAEFVVWVLEQLKGVRLTDALGPAPGAGVRPAREHRVPPPHPSTMAGRR